MHFVLCITLNADPHLISEVCSADEVTLVDTVHGTNRHALAASGTKVVIDGSEVVDNLDSAVRTGLLTLHTADTAVGAYLSCHSALVVVGALNYHTGSILDKVDDTVGTLSYTNATADTLSGVNSCHAVFNGDSVLGTSNCTVAVAKTSVVTHLVTAVNHICGEAGLVSLVLELSFGRVAGTVAGNVCNLLNNVCRLNAEDSCDLLSGVVAAGNTKVGGIGSLVSEGLSIAVTAGVAAGATIGAGQTLTDSDSGLILLYRKEYCGKGEEQCAEERNAEKKKHGE